MAFMCIISERFNSQVIMNHTEEGKNSLMTAIFSRIRFNIRQVAAMAVFVAVASIAQMISPTLVSGMIGFNGFVHVIKRILEQDEKA